MMCKYSVFSLIDHKLTSQLLKKIDEQIARRLENLIQIEKNELIDLKVESFELKKTIYLEIEEYHYHFLNVVKKLEKILKMKNKNEQSSYDSVSLSSSNYSENSSKSLEWDTFFTEQDPLLPEEKEKTYFSEEDFSNSSKRSSMMSFSQLHSTSENMNSSFTHNQDINTEKNKKKIMCSLDKYLFDMKNEKLFKNKVATKKFSKEKSKGRSCRKKERKNLEKSFSFNVCQSKQDGFQNINSSKKRSKPIDSGTFVYIIKKVCFLLLMIFIILCSLDCFFKKMYTVAV